MRHLVRLCGVIVLLSGPAFAQSTVDRGAYLVQMGGCVSCHKSPNGNKADLAGGHALKTPFGTFYVPNITPDPDSGIGGWSEADFIQAMTEGLAPDGSHYYPAFPYPSYTNMTRQDLVDLKAYLDQVSPVKNVVPDHDLSFPFNMRFLMMGWKLLFFETAPFQPQPDKSEEWNRGAYIVNGPGHCGECHTPRNAFGAPDMDRRFQGNPDGPEKEKIPSMLPDWGEQEYFMALRMGMTPEGDFLGGSMGHVVSNTTSKLTKSDLKAVITYLNDLP